MRALLRDAEDRCLTGALEKVGQDTPEGEPPDDYQPPVRWSELPEPPPLKWVVDGLIYRKGIAMFVGRPKSGKTGAALTLAALVSSDGGDFYGRPIHPGNVLYLDYENPRSLTHKRLRALEGAGLSLEGLHPMLGERSQPSFLMSMERLRRYVGDCGPTVVFLDGLLGATGVDDLSDYAKLYPAFDAFRKLADEADCAIVIMHHGRKSGGSQGEQAAGSVVIPGQCDVMLSFEVQDDYSRFEVRTDCLRDGEHLPRSVVTEGEGGMSQLYGTVAKANRDERTLEMQDSIRLQLAGGEVTHKAIMGSFPGTAPAAIRDALQGLANMGEVEHLGKRGGRDQTALRYRFR